MTKFAIRNTEEAYNPNGAIYFGKKGFEFGASLVVAEKAKTFKSKVAADEFLACMKASGYKMFAVIAL